MIIQNRHTFFQSLRTEYRHFTYESFDFSINEEGLHIQFYFSIDSFVEFRPTMNIPAQDFIDFNRLSESQLSNFVFHIGMVELISYWKSICTKEIIIKPYQLDSTQINFWKKLYFHGLGEFFYLNHIETNYEDFLNIHSNSNSPSLQAFSLPLDDSAIIPVGGGKDSVVSLEILKSYGNNLALIMNPRGASVATANIAGFENKTLIINRSIDSALLKLNADGFLNGHTPFSALLAFSAVLAAAISGKKYLALSNESSANESTVVGTMVNHQYSKSLEFERDFRNYVQHYITPDIQYFSLLRPLSEFQIASIFAKNPQYFSEFKSCNVGSKTNIWCGHCPKCLFTFIILSPFVEVEVLISIFGSNLLDNKELKLYFDELTGLSAVKPFECVGTVSEVIAALCLSIPRYQELPVLLKYFNEKLGPKSCSSLNHEQLLNRIETEHFVEERYLQLIQAKLATR